LELGNPENRYGVCSVSELQLYLPVDREPTADEKTLPTGHSTARIPTHAALQALLRTRVRPEHDGARLRSGPPLDAVPYLISNGCRKVRHVHSGRNLERPGRAIAAELGWREFKNQQQHRSLRLYRRR